MFEIVADTPTHGEEVIDEALNEDQADWLVGEYRLAYQGTGIEVWHRPHQAKPSE